MNSNEVTVTSQGRAGFTLYTYPIVQRAERRMEDKTLRRKGLHAFKLASLRRGKRDGGGERVKDELDHEGDDHDNDDDDGDVPGRSSPE